MAQFEPERHIVEINAPVFVDRFARMRRAQQFAGDEWKPADVPDTGSLKVLREAAAGYRSCPLYKNATQTVFGEGPKSPVVFVGEQPGDQEDLQGRPFCGPAGTLFDRALAEAGIDRASIYVTNAVKHFKWGPRGKRRIHQSPPDATSLPAAHGWSRN